MSKINVNRKMPLLLAVNAIVFPEIPDITLTKHWYKHCAKTGHRRLVPDRSNAKEEMA